MTLDAWIALGGVAAVFVALAFTRVPPYLVILGGVLALLFGRVVTPAAAFAGFANQGVLTVAALFIVASGVDETGALVTLVNRLLGAPGSARSAQMRVVAPVTAASAFLNNTPIVAILMPLVSDWGRRIRVHASQLLMPLSFAAVLGGLCTLIGTSTNLVIHGLLLESGLPGLGFFDISRVGVPCALAGVAYILIAGRKLLPRHEDALQIVEDPREYTLEMVVTPDGPLVGMTISQAGLRRLDGVYLMEIHRRGHVHTAVGPDENLEANDQLVFVGVVDSVVDLQKIPGLRPATQQLFKLDTPRSDRWFVEAVISHSCPIVGQTIREGHFRSRYNAVVIGVGRNGERIRRRLGDIALQPGDVLLLEALPAFVEQQRNSNDFYLVSRIEGVSPPRHERGWAALAIMVAMIVVAAAGWVSMLQAAAGAAALMLLTRCTSEETARRRIDWQLLIAIAASFGLGNALARTGAAEAVAHALLSTAGSRPMIAMILLYGVTMILSALISNNATAVVVLPIALAVASDLGVSTMPFVMTVMLASSASFFTPLGYQTHLMVWGPGGYHMRDFVRFGLPLALVVWAVAMLVMPYAWPF